MSANRKGLFIGDDGKSLMFTFILVSSLFLLWGFCNGMIDVMDKHFQEELGLSKSQSAWVQFAHYLGYFLMSMQRLKSNTVLADSIEEVEALLKDVTAEKGGGKFVMAHLKDDPRCDARIKEFKATIRCIPLVDEYDGPGRCIVTGEPVDRRVVIAKAY